MNLAEKLSDLIDKWDIVGLSVEIKKPEHEEWITNNAWDLIPVLVEPANEENLQQCPQVVHTCSQILADFVAKFGNPKEIIISLLEQCEHSGSSVRFRHCLPALEISLLKLNLKVASKTWDWALRTVIDHITALDLPNLVELEGDERLVFEHDQIYSDRLRSCEEATNLLKSLAFKMKEFGNEKDDSGVLKSQLKGYIIWSCVQILGRPLSYFNVCETDKGNATTAKVICDQLISLLNQLCPDQIKLIDLQDFCLYYNCPKVLDSDRDIWAVGMGNLFHCQFSNIDPNFPLCYAPFHLFSVLLNSMIQMLNYHGDTDTTTPAPYFRQEKSLYLCKTLLSRLHVNSIPADVLEMEEQSLLCSKLYQIIIYHGLQSVRKLAYEVYNQYFDVFGGNNPKALTMLVKFSLEKANHSGLIGHAIGKLKNGILFYIRDPASYPPEKLCGTQLHSLVKRFCALKNGAETDLLEVSDEIMASLNFLVCILLRDRNNTLGLLEIVPQIEIDFLKPLNAGLAMSQAHYKLKLDESKNDCNNHDGAEVSLMVGGKALPQMSQHQMKEVVHSALNTFSMMECVLCQLNDVISSKKAVK